MIINAKNHFIRDTIGIRPIFTFVTNNLLNTINCYKLI